MKYILILCLFLYSCSDDTMTITKTEYQKLTGNPIAAKYPKVINVPNDNKDNTKSFEVYLGSDGHEYMSHHESHIANQWTHYGGCELCQNRYDTLLFYLKHTK